MNKDKWKEYLETIKINIIRLSELLSGADKAEKAPALDFQGVSILFRIVRRDSGWRSLPLRLLARDFNPEPESMVMLVSEDDEVEISYETGKFLSSLVSIATSEVKVPAPIVVSSRSICGQFMQFTAHVSGSKRFPRMHKICDPDRSREFAERVFGMYEESLTECRSVLLKVPTDGWTRNDVFRPSNSAWISVAVGDAVLDDPITHAILSLNGSKIALDGFVYREADTHVAPTLRNFMSFLAHQSPVRGPGVFVGRRMVPFRGRIADVLEKALTVRKGDDLDPFLSFSMLCASFSEYSMILSAWRLFLQHVDRNYISKVLPIPTGGCASGFILSAFARLNRLLEDKKLLDSLVEEEERKLKEANLWDIGMDLAIDEDADKISSELDEDADIDIDFDQEIDLDQLDEMESDTGEEKEDEDFEIKIVRTERAGTKESRRYGDVEIWIPQTFPLDADEPTRDEVRSDMNAFKAANPALDLNSYLLWRPALDGKVEFLEELWEEATPKTLLEQIRGKDVESPDAKIRSQLLELANIDRETLLPEIFHPFLMESLSWLKQDFEDPREIDKFFENFKFPNSLLELTLDSVKEIGEIEAKKIKMVSEMHKRKYLEDESGSLFNLEGFPGRYLHQADCEYRNLRFYMDVDGCLYVSPKN